MMRSASPARADQRRLGDLPHPPGGPGQVVLGQPAGPDVLQRDSGLDSEQPERGVDPGCSPFGSS